MENKYLLQLLRETKERADYLANLGFPRSVACVKNTQDNFCPNFNKNQVILKFHSCINHYEKYIGSGRKKKLNKDFKPIYRVSVWGGDDTGMDIDFDNPEEAKKLFNELKVLNYLNVDTLRSYGLKYF
jgi:hypothetical protein